MLIDSIRSLFGANAEPSGSKDTSADAPSAADSNEANPLHVAACALLLDVAYADGEFSVEERAHLADALQRHFALGADAGERLLALAEAEHNSSIDQFRFTARLREEYDLGQKMVLAEVMWGVVLSDGEINEHEAFLTRKISNLLDLAPGYLSVAKGAAEKKKL